MENPEWNDGPTRQHVEEGSSLPSNVEVMEEWTVSHHKLEELEGRHAAEPLLKSDGSRRFVLFPIQEPEVSFSVETLWTSAPRFIELDAALGVKEACRHRLPRWHALHLTSRLRRISLPRSYTLWNQ